MPDQAPEKKISALQQGIAKLKARRTLYVPRHIIFVLLGVSVILFTLADSVSGGPLQTFLLISSFIAGAPALWSLRAIGKIDDELRTNVIPEVVRIVRPNVRYSPISKLRTEDLNHSLALPWIAFSSSASDEFLGEYRGVKYELHHFLASRENRNDSFNSSTSGLFVKVDIRQILTGKTRIEFDQLTSLWGSAPSGLEAIQLENAEFEEHFNVSTTDPIEARTVLTPKMMEQLVKLHKEMRLPLSCTFLSTGLYIFVPGCHLELEVTQKTDLTSIGQTVEATLVRIENVIETLELNKKLGFKKRKGLVRLG